MKVRALLPTVMVAFSSSLLASCSEQGSSARGGDSLGVSQGALTVTTSEEGPAAGSLISVVVRENGDVACLKADGGSYTSAKGGHVEFYQSKSGAPMTFVGQKEYPPYDPANLEYEVTLKGAALALGVGEGHRAQCVVMPYIDLSKDPKWDGEYCGDKNVPCTRSGIFTFSVVTSTGQTPTDPPATPDAPALAGNCGNGESKGKGKNTDEKDLFCVGMHTASASSYQYPFNCARGAGYRVKLTTAKGSTKLSVRDSEGTVYGTSSSKGATDELFLRADSETEKCEVRVEVLKLSKFQLQISQVAHLGPTGQPTFERTTVILDAGHRKTDDGTNDGTAIIERGYNERLVQYALAAFGPAGARREMVSYDGVVLPWASEFFDVSEEELRSRESSADYGMAGFRGYVMRAWVHQTGRQASRTYAVQLHNNKAGWGNDGSGALVAGGDESAVQRWKQELQAAMNDARQTKKWEDFPLDNERMGFVRGASGWKMCPTIVKEADCDSTKTNATSYGPVLAAAALLEVAHYDASPKLWWDDIETYKTEEEFIAAAGGAIGQHALDLADSAQLP